MKADGARQRAFSLHWGSGVIEEECGDAAGTYEIRFCHYDLRGRFQRSPLILDADDLPRLRAALRGAPKLRKLLGRVF